MKTFWQRFLHEHWMIGWIDQPIENSLGWDKCPPVRWIGGRSRSCYLADPFLWPGKPDTVLCESFSFAEQTGTLRKLVVDGDVIREDTPVQLPLTGHLSFPFMFQHDGETYLMPESGAARRLVLYRWHEESHSWQEYATPLPDTAAADSVFFEFGGLFWIAYTDADIDNFNNLNLCYANSLKGPWQKHAGNPVVRNDPHTARCGGTPFWREGKLYRVAQDCAGDYGTAVHIMEIMQCSPSKYQERHVNHIAPEPGINPHGFHSLSACGSKCLVDGKKMVFSPLGVLKRLIKYVQRGLPV